MGFILMSLLCALGWLGGSWLIWEFISGRGWGSYFCVCYHSSLVTDGLPLEMAEKFLFNRISTYRFGRFVISIGVPVCLFHNWFQEIEDRSQEYDFAGGGL